MTIDKDIPIKNIFYMLTYAFKELNREHYKRVETENFGNIHDMFAEILYLGISYLLKQGLHREYVDCEDTLSTLRGKLDVRATIKEKMRHTAKLACAFDEFSSNNIFNQVLKATVVLLLGCGDVKSARKGKIRKLMLFFENVENIDLKSVRWSCLRYDRNTQTYQMLHSICYFVAFDLLLTTENGNQQVPMFSDENMALLFQRFILEYYRKEHSDYGAKGCRVKWNLDEDEVPSSLLPTMNTDVTLRLGDRTLIIDAKYYSHTLQENFGKQTIHSANLYQIYAYVTNEDIDKNGYQKGNVDGMLLYAMTEKYGKKSERIKLKAGNVIYVKTLDLSQDFEEIKKQLDEFALSE